MEAILERNSRARAAWTPIAIVALVGILLATAFTARAEANVSAFQGLASSPVELTAFAADPGTGLMYAQEDGGTSFFRYDPRTNAWSELAPSPLASGNNGGAAWLNGKIYVVYTGNEEELAVYDIASDSWDTIENPLLEGTGDIAAGKGKLFLAVGTEFLAYDPAAKIATELAEPPAFEAAECNEGFEKWGGLQVVGGKIYGHQGNGCTGFGVYDIATNSWQQLPYAPGIQIDETSDPEGPLLGSAYDPVTNSYLTYGPYGGKTLYRFDIEANSWSTGPLPFEVDDGGMAYISLPGLEGVYMIQGEEGTEFTRYTERNLTDLAPSMSAHVAKGGKITYSIQVKNNGPERAGEVVLSNPLPAGATLVSAVTSLGTCTATSVLTCNLGLLRSGTSASLTVQIKTRSKQVTNVATVSSQAVDSAAGNDSARVVAKQCVVPKIRNRGVKGAKKSPEEGQLQARQGQPALQQEGQGQGDPRRQEPRRAPAGGQQGQAGRLPRQEGRLAGTAADAAPASHEKAPLRRGFLVGAPGSLHDPGPGHTSKNLATFPD